MVKNNQVYFFLLAIVVISFFGYLYVFETNSTETLGKNKKAILMAIWFVSIAVIGFYGSKYTKEKWVISIWVMQYLFAFLFSACYLGLYFYLDDFPMNIKTVMASIRNFYLTPVPFAFLLLMRKIQSPH
jgi:hypothetical protein